MKVRIELVEDIQEDEVLIRCGRVDDSIKKIHQYILAQSSQNTKITFYKKNEEYYFPMDEVYFFETEGEHIYAHTKDDEYRIKHRLYELEELLPRHFARASKSAIVNIKKVYSIARNITASSLITFIDSHKNMYVSRYYYKELRQRLNERSTYEK